MLQIAFFECFWIQDILEIYVVFWWIFGFSDSQMIDHYCSKSEKKCKKLTNSSFLQKKVKKVQKVDRFVIFELFWEKYIFSFTEIMWQNPNKPQNPKMRCPELTKFWSKSRFFGAEWNRFLIWVIPIYISRCKSYHSLPIPVTL